nr:hypothetical protein [Halegenticoccus tardaugens]
MAEIPTIYSYIENAVGGTESVWSGVVDPSEKVENAWNRLSTGERGDTPRSWCFEDGVRYGGRVLPPLVARASPVRLSAAIGVQYLTGDEVVSSDQEEYTLGHLLDGAEPIQWRAVTDVVVGVPGRPYVWAAIPVQMNLGASAQTWMPCSAHSTASVRVRLFTPAFDAQYGDHSWRLWPPIATKR